MTDIRPALLRTWRVAIRLGPTLVLVFAAVTYWVAERARVEPSDDELSLAAGRVSKAVDVYLARTVNDLAMITNLPELRKKAADETGRGGNVDDEQRLDAEWLTPDQDGGLEWRVTEILENEWSKYLRTIVRLQGTIIREIAIADRGGRLFAASVRTDDYLQDKDDWWPQSFEGFVSCRGAAVDCALYPAEESLRWDASAASWGIDVVLSIFASAPDGSVVGILKAVIDPLQDLDPLMANDLDVTLLSKKNGKPLVVRSTPLALEKVELDALKDLKRGTTVLFDVGGPVRVRALSGPLGEHWAVAVSKRPVQNAAAWKIPALWLALTIAALVLTMSARQTAANPDPAPAATLPPPAEIA